MATCTRAKRSDVRTTIGRFLDGFSTLSLATQGPDGPGAAALFFARDSHLNLYFVSSRRARHVANLLAFPSVAVTVNADQPKWKLIRGLQISGTAEVVAEKDRTFVTELYLRKFGDMRQILSAPSDAVEKTMADRFRTSEFFRIRPAQIRMIDNWHGFGHRTEYVLESREDVDQAAMP